MVNINSKSAARPRVREAQNKANEARLGRERQDVDDAASFLVELGRLAAIDEWERNRILEIRAEEERRRHEHGQASATAVATAGHWPARGRRHRTARPHASSVPPRRVRSAQTEEINSPIHERATKCSPSRRRLPANVMLRPDHIGSGESTRRADNAVPRRNRATSGGDDPGPACRVFRGKLAPHSSIDAVQGLAGVIDGPGRCPKDSARSPVESGQFSAEN
ncbi:hypothetical protein [Mycobacterium nebraskense]|uniref:hypothetical protein n=1 Tax=Mycobacterium nebraskense TaxID=244292 RepID=UPI0023F33132|nr:hypothetical protein [Mycobacterium nebraskense]